MAKQVELFIGDEQVDVYDSKSLKMAVTYSIAELNKIDRATGTISKTVTLPATHNNRKVFGFTEDVNSVEGLDQRTKPGVRVLINGTNVLDGSMKISEVILDGKNNAIEYKVVLIGNNGAWKSDLDGLSLRDLDLSDQDHLWDKAAIDLSETVNPGRDYVYPVASYGAFDPNINFEVDDFTILGGNAVEVTLDGAPDISWVTQGIYFRLGGMNQDEKNIKYLVLSATPTIITAIATTNLPGFATSEINSDGVMNIVRAGSVQLTSRYPAMNIKRILERIFLEAEYTIASDFFDTGFFKALYLPFTQKVFTHAEGFADNQQYRAGMASDLTLTTSAAETRIPLSVDSGGEFFDTGSNWNTTTFGYVATENVRQRFRVEILYTNALPSFPFLRIRQNGQVVVKKNLKDGTDVLDVLETPYLDISVGDLIEVTVQNILVANVTNTFVVKSANTRFYNTTLDEIIEGSTVQLAPNLPDMSQIDFIKGVKHLFNLYFATDVAKREVVIEPRDDFFQEDKPLNWTDKVDHSVPIMQKFLGSNLAETNTLKFLAGKDGVIALINEREGIDFGAAEINIANKFTSKKDKAIANKVFSATVMGLQGSIGFVTTPLPRLWEKYEFDPKWNTDHIPRVLFYDGVQNMGPNEQWIWENTVRTDWPSFYSFNNLKDNSSTLLFNDTLRSNGLAQRFYRNTFKQVDEGRQMIAWINLTEVDIANLDFRRVLFIELEAKGTYWQLEKVSNYNPLSDKPTRCEFLSTVETVDPAPVSVIAEGNPEQPGDDNVDMDPGFTPEPKNFPGPAESIPQFDTTGNLINKAAGNKSNVEDAMIFGVGLEASAPNQIVIGKFNLPDDLAQMIIGGGDPLNLSNLLVVDGEGNLLGGGQALLTEIDGISMPMMYDDGDDNAQEMKTDY